MKNVLFVDASMRDDSRTLKLCKSYLEKNFADADLKIRSLKEEEIKPFNEDMLKERDKDISNGDFSSDRYKFAREFAEADTVVIGAPYWDFSFPAKLKLYFEHIFVTGITFKYVEGIPKGLGNTKELIYITTAGGYIPENSSLETYLKEMCFMFGIENLKFYKAEGLDIEGNDPENIIKNADFI